MQTNLRIIPYFRLEDLFYAQGVDLILQAHEHSYERMWPVYHDVVFSRDYNNPQTPVHITSGAAGCKEENDAMGKQGMRIIN